MDTDTFDPPPDRPTAEGMCAAMMRAVWNGVVLAESPTTVQVEGNHYFPADTIHREYFADSSTTTVCPWKGTASYYTVSAGGKSNPDAAWYYPQPKDAAAEIKDHVAFWRGVTVEVASQSAAHR